tara:strand:+ start:576 stop:1133 length:558 start_codon:yes stop_codon:yes gene_type:complete
MATTLKIGQIDEFSLVPRSLGRPANEHATITLTKTQEGGAQVPTETPAIDIQKAIDDAVAKAKAESAAELAEVRKTANALQEAADFAKVADFCKSNGLKVELANPLRAIEKAAPAEYALVSAELVRLQKAADAVSVLTSRISTTARPSANGDLEKAIAPMIASGMSREAAITKAITANHELAGVN